MAVADIEMAWRSRRVLFLNRYHEGASGRRAAGSRSAYKNNACMTRAGGLRPQ